MRRISYKSYIALGVVLFALLNLSNRTAQNVRSCAVAILAPPWQAVYGALFFLEKLPTIIAARPFAYEDGSRQKIYTLERENYALRQQVEQLKHQVSLQDGLFQLLQKIQNADLENPFFQRRASEIFKIADLQMHALEAKIIYRDPVSWTSSVWVNAGERNNRILGFKVISMNSPVVIGNYLVGVVDYVGETRSRIRLITDAAVVPAVRAVRQQRPAQDLYLGKGELHGASLPLWRSRGQLLKGIGFNYDFADAEGPALHLLTGGPVDRLDQEKKPLISKGDLLVTTGFDGVFPPGLVAAEVMHAFPLQEGACSYEIVAKVACPDFEELRFITILPNIENF